ncbi:hypothetical protein [Actinomadura livida]|uniref:Uncharacterized protein n=1 Tax=Actinomadura livida TaxID=79909 RepID=A0A7W7IIL9_9ACTN|nr:MULTISPECIES: hypothetical protein [Actinomadura]MBB4777685.1 hypothetical protein [Actinomadura catellatispora]GGT99407.1 hypothetical protein GCM10010208_23890 [Actinomadura livida]
MSQRSDSQLVTVTSDLSSLTAWVAESNTTRDAIDQIARGTESLAKAHRNTPAKKLLPEVMRLQRQTQSILQSGKQRLSETRDLYKLHSDLLAHTCMLLGDLKQDQIAEQHGYAATLMANEAEATGAIAWGARAKTARWQDKYVESADLARQGYDRSPQEPIRVQLAWYEANAAALLGDHNRANEAAQRAHEAAEFCLDTSSGLSVWSFPTERQALFALSVATITGDADGALRAAAMADAGWESGDPQLPATWAQIRVGAGIAHLMKGSLEAAIGEVTPMLDLDPQFRLSTVTRYLEKLYRRLGHQRFQGSPAAAQLREDIQAFNSEALKGYDDSEAQ